VKKNLIRLLLAAMLLVSASVPSIALQDGTDPPPTCNPWGGCVR
jgi:hypothetical protein